MRILYIAEIVGKAGVFAVKQALPGLKQRYKIDFVLGDADGVTGGAGLGRQHAAYLRKLGLEALCGGECSFYKKDLVEGIEKTPWFLRPANLSRLAPGHGWRIFHCRNGQKIGVVVLLGQSGFRSVHAGSPVNALEPLMEIIHKETPIVVIDFHAQPTAEKLTFTEAARQLPEKLRPTAIFGSHTRVQTADESLDRGIAAITDAGRSGVVDSVGGSNIQSRIREYLNGIPEWTRDAYGPCALEAVLVDSNDKGTALSIERIHANAGIMRETEK
jgi:metallophosphoesterase (TIGR00282 family)